MEENALSEFSSEDAAFIIKATIELYLDRISIALEPLHTDSRYTAQAAEFFLKDEFSSFFSDEQVSELLSPVKSLILDTETPESLALLELTRREGYSYTLNRKNPLYYHALEELTKVFRLVKSAQNAILRADETQCGDILQTLETLKARFESGTSSTQSRRHTISPIDTTIKKAVKLTLLDIFEKYKKEKTGSVRDSTLEATKKKLIVVSELLDNTSVESITRDDVLEVKQKLLLLPTNIKKIKEFRNLSYKEAIKKNQRLKKECLSESTVKDYLEKTSSIIKYGMLHKHVTYNAFEAISFSKKSKSSIDDRDPFTSPQLESIYDLDIFQKQNFRKAYHFWLPLLGLYTGARIGELSQIYSDDVVRIDGIWCLDIKNEGKRRTKNAASVRLVPIHSKLIELGFLDFMQNQNGHVFKELTYSEKSGYGGNSSKWFGYLKTKLGMPKRTTCFHSYRHTVIDFYKQNTNVDKRFVQAIVGHSNNSITFDVYGSDFKPSVLQPYIEMMKWNISSLNNIVRFDAEKHKG